MKKILTVFGTRPEAINLAPLLLKMRGDSEINSRICVTAQHRDMLDSVLNEFGIIPDHDLDVMKYGQTLSYVTEAVLNRVDQVLAKEAPDAIIVHGDTSTAFASALAAFYRGIPVCHVEAGLRSGDITSPFPEEFNRRSLAQLATIHFAPTEAAVNNLLSEGIAESRIHLVGNTVIDTLLMHSNTVPLRNCKERTVLMTVHRREHTENDLRSIFTAVKQICLEDSSVRVIYPLHKSPRIRSVACEILGGVNGITLTEPLTVAEFHYLLKSCHFVLTDSGGVQEEAAFLGKPLLLVRNNTERPEGQCIGCVKLIGTNCNRVFKEIRALLYDTLKYEKMSVSCTAFGDGYASDRIISVLKKM